MKLGFISDLHLSKNIPSVTEGFFKFLQTAAQELSHLYILGDLFEVWVGDDDDSKLATSVIKEINHATRNGLEIFFIHGNRDFLCGESFAEQSNITLLPDPFFFNFFDLKIALSHGDDFCTEDLEYIKFKKEVRSPKWQREFLQKPLNERISIASNMRDASQKNNNNKKESIMDVTPAAIEDFFEQHHIDLLIHGHTHRPMTHKHNTGTRIVLGDWHETGWCLMLDEQQQELKEFIL
ncbi:UDP-2,3-diacylglucosamine diphosphatase [Gammaproteobacteria bacterium]|jgi:UDP-2,3-diacylglucosamine hydrolase|nr:UDP-2,3-diacylglucosamine diphosphatase [Gammaproteobacteria bacterium]